MPFTAWKVSFHMTTMGGHLIGCSHSIAATRPEGEVKKPHASSGQQLLNDRCKLALEMKKMLDAMVEGKDTTSHNGPVTKV